MSLTLAFGLHTRLTVGCWRRRVLAARLVLRDPATGERVGEPIKAGTPSGAAFDFAFTPDGSSVLTSSEGQDTAVTQWDLNTRRETRSIEGRGGGALAVSPDGRVVAIGRADGSVGLVDLQTGRERATSDSHGSAVTSAVFSRDGKTLVTTSNDRTAIVWDVESGARREVLRGHTASVHSAVFSPEGNTLYTVGLDPAAIAWDLTGNRRLGRAFAYTYPGGPGPGPEVRFHTGRFSPDGNLIAIGLYGGGIGFRSAADLESVGARIEAGDVSTFDFSRDGKILAAVTWDGQASIWDVRSRSQLGSFRVSPVLGGRTLPSVSISSDGTKLAVTGPNGATLWDVATGAKLGTVGDGSQAAGVSIDPSGQLIAFGRSDINPDRGKVEIWNIRGHERITTVNADRIGALAVVFSPDGKLLATGAWESIVRLWDPKTGKLIRQFDARAAGIVASVAFSPDGSTLAAAGSNGSIVMWDVATGVQIAKLEGGVPATPGAVLATSTDFSPDGKRLLMTMSNGFGVVWDVDPESWARRACEVANRTLTEEEWEQFLPDRPYEPACATG